MSVPTRPANVVRALAVSLGLIIVALVGALFGVPMEATAPANGVVVSSRTVEFRAQQSGLVELNVRIGDSRQAGQVLATIRPDDLPRISDYWRDLLPDWHRELNKRPDPQVVTVPEGFASWLVLDVRAMNGQRVQAGDLLASLVPIDPASGRPIDLRVRLEFDERHFGFVAAGQSVRFESAMYNHRLFGRASGRIERLEPAGVENPSGAILFYSIATLDESPFEMKIGSSVQAEVVTGRRSLVRVILEH